MNEVGGIEERWKLDTRNVIMLKVVLAKTATREQNLYVMENSNVVKRKCKDYLSQKIFKWFNFEDSRYPGHFAVFFAPYASKVEKSGPRTISRTHKQKNHGIVQQQLPLPLSPNAI